MGWFDEQIKSRIHNDEENFQNAFVDLSSVVLGKSVIAKALNNDRAKTQSAVEEILKFYHIRMPEDSPVLEDMNEQLDYFLRPSGIMRRNVSLTGDWYKNGMGALLGYNDKGDPIALIPRGVSGYAYFDYETGNRVAVNRKNAAAIQADAICFYKPLPLRALTMKDLFAYIVGTLSVGDYLMILAATLAVTLMGMFTPYANQQLFGKVIPAGEMSLLLPVACLLLGVTLSSTLITITKTLVMTRLQTKLDVAVQAAAMSRVLTLPATFFRDYASGDLASRTNSVSRLCKMLLDAALSTGLTSLFSLIYIGQIMRYSPALVAPALIVIAVTLAFTLLSTFAQMRVTRKRMQLSAKLFGIVYSLFSGVQKIKLAGAERRAFTRWSDTYKKDAELTYNPPMLLKLNGVINLLITGLGTVLIYYSAARSGVSVADYMTFNVTYGMISGAFMALASIALTAANIKPVMEMVKPLLETEPEVSTAKKMLTKLTGSIELNNVSFRYAADGPMIIDDLSLKIRPGQYVAIVGTTGCGKSTLLRLMLGFETPLTGSVYYDGKDIDKIDLKSLRQHIGCVMQNGKLFTGDIYSNIVISAPWLTLDDAWAAAELAGLADDIRAMPMGMHTIVSEGGGGISGGQKQRLLIARAIAPKPKVLMFDEATSALDNITQKLVSQSLDRLKSTRIVIAHRLSTIRQCDRIIVLDKGRIIEDGKYEDLVKNNGFFQELVKRQQIDSPEDVHIGKTTAF